MVVAIGSTVYDFDRIPTCVPVEDDRPVRIYTHRVLLQNCEGGEVMISVTTLSDKFSVVLKEVNRAKAELGLKGYYVLETPDAPSPF